MKNSLGSTKRSTGQLKAWSLKAMKTVITVGFFIACVIMLSDYLSVRAAGGDLDTSFDPGTGASDNFSQYIVLKTALQRDGKIVIGGQFTSYNGTARNRIARINADGSLDFTFDPGTGANSIVTALAIQANGKIMIGGSFSSFNGIARNRIARVNSDGSLDTSFNPGSGANSAVTAITMQNNGQIIMAGDFTTYNGTTRNRIARLNPDGSLDLSFDPGTGANSYVLAATVQADGKVIVGGQFTNYGGTGPNHIARLHSDGSLDTSFNPGTGANASVREIGLQTGGRIVIGGDFSSVNGVDRQQFARLNSDGSLDMVFNHGMPGNQVLALTVQGDDKIIIGGGFGVGRRNPNGSFDTTFNPGAVSGVNSTAVQSDGKIIIAGSFSSYSGTPRRGVARLLSAPGALSFSSSEYSVSEGDSTATITVTRTGGSDNKVVARIDLTDVTTSPADYDLSPASLEPAFGSGEGANGLVFTSARQPDGKIIIGGAFSRYNGTVRNRIARLNPDGSLDMTFQSIVGADLPVFAIALQSDGKMIIGGQFTSYNGTLRNRIARLNSDGSLDMTFDPGSGFNATVFTSFIQNGKIVLGGDFTTYNGIECNHIVRLNLDGSLDTSFLTGVGASASVRSARLQSDGKIVIGGLFLAYNGIQRQFVARLNSDGSLDMTFNPGSGANSSILMTALQDDGRILIGGHFTSYNGTPRNRIARLNSDGSLDMTFDPGSGANLLVLAFAFQEDGKIIIGGDFDTYNGASRNRIARLNPDGSLDMAFDPGSGFNSSVHVAAVEEDGKILIGGSFTNYNGIERNRIARLKGDLLVTWNAGDSSDKTVSIPIVDDLLVEGNETLSLELIPLRGGATLGTFPIATLTIIDNDQAPSPSPSENTQPGTGVSVQPLDSTTGATSPVSMSFSEVTSGGTTTVTSSTTGPPPPSGFRLGNPPTYYDISTTATFEGPVTVCINYGGASYGNESALRLMHFENGAWYDITTSLDTNTKTICGETTSLSPFVVLETDMPPEITVPDSILAYATSTAGAVVFYSGATATDDFDGTVSVSCSPSSGSTFGLGTTTVMCSATDSAGNTATKSFSVNVRYSWSDVLPPVKADGTSIFKLGSTVPVKFQLTGASAGIENAIARLYWAKISDGILGAYEEAVSTAAATSGNQFRYDAVEGQYIFNWGTKGLSEGTYQLRIDMGDGELRVVNVSLKR